MTVMQYEMWFSGLAHHAVWLVPTDRERIMRFVNGLTYQLRILITRERVTGATFKEVVDIASEIELVRRHDQEEREAKRPRGSGNFSSAPSRGQFQQGRGRPFRQTYSAHPGYRGASSGHGSHNSNWVHSSLSALPAHSSSCAPSVQSSSMPGPSTGHSGARGSLQSPSLTSESCYECGEFGHMRRQCPRLRDGQSQQRDRPSTSAPVTSPPTNPARGRGQFARGHPIGGGRSGGGQAHFYALPRRSDVATSDVVILGIVSVCHRDASLSPCRAILDCHAKTVTLAIPDVPQIEWRGVTDHVPTRVILFLKAQQMVGKSCLSYLAFVRDVGVETPSIDFVPIVRDFPDVFPADLLGMPPDRDIDFGIDLVPGTQPTSIPLYRMTPAELKELKAQLQELLDKGQEEHAEHLRVALQRLRKEKL
ncbi:uncharacterized protein [Nicotiana sylvestris]|uniref:uncharacterized protein n=1 Tax=Nicotiana sylvestris TaxID=4096 RepID=UPI00388C8A6A